MKLSNLISSIGFMFLSTLAYAEWLPLNYYELQANGKWKPRALCGIGEYATSLIEAKGIAYRNVVWEKKWTNLSFGESESDDMVVIRFRDVGDGKDYQIIFFEDMATCKAYSRTKVDIVDWIRNNPLLAGVIGAAILSGLSGDQTGSQKSALPSKAAQPPVDDGFRQRYSMCAAQREACLAQCEGLPGSGRGILPGGGVTPYSECKYKCNNMCVGIR